MLQDVQFMNIIIKHYMIIHDVCWLYIFMMCNIRYVHDVRYTMF